MPGKKITDLDIYDDINTDKSKRDLFEVSKNTGTYASPTYAPDGSRKISVEQLKETLNIKDYLVRDFVVINSGGTILEDKVNAIVVSADASFTLPTADSSNYGKSLVIVNRSTYTVTINGIVNGTSIKLTNFNETIQLSCLFDGVSTYGWWLISDARTDKICSNLVELVSNTYTAKHNDNIEANAVSVGSDINITIPTAGIEGRFIYVFYPSGSPSVYVVNLIGGFTATLLQLDYFLIRDNGSYWEAISTSQNTATVEPAFNLSVPTGVCEGGILSINADPTKFNISDGFGYISDLYTDTDPANATITKVTWSGLTAQTVTNLATSTVSFIYINSAGAIVQGTTEPTEATLRDYIYIGQLGHSNLTSISTAISQPSVAQSPMSQLRDLWGEIGFVNAGNEISANGANLSINKSNGFLTGLGINFENAIKTPNRKNYPLQTLATIRRRTQTGGTGTNTTLDVLNYDLSGTVTTITGTKAQNQRVFLLPSGNIVIQYGQTLYNSLTDAIQGIDTETFVKLENIKTGQLIAIISVLSTCTSLQDTNRARIKNLGKWGEVNVGAGSSSVSTLQQAYLNSVDPEIDTVNGAVSFKNGGANNTVDVIEVKNLANSQTFSVDGNGLIKSAQATASTPAFFSTVKGIISATGALLGTWFQTLTAKSTPVDADTIVVNDSASSFEAKKTTLSQLFTYILGKLGFSSLTNNLYTYYDTSTSSFKSGRIGWVTSLDFFAVYRSDLSTANSITINSTNNAIVYTQSGSNLLGLDYTSYARLGGNGGTMLMAGVGSFANGYFWVTNGNNYHANTIHHFADNPGTVQARLSTSGLAIGSSTINASAQLDLQSTTKGFLKPRLTSAQIASISTPAQGLHMFNTDLRSDVIIPTSSGNPIRVSGTMFTQTANAQVQNTVTETSLIGTGIGSNTIKANSSGIGTTYRLSMWGYISNTGSPFAQIKIKIGSVVIFDTTSSGMFAITGNQNFKVSALFTVRSLGASGTVIGQGEFEYATSASTQYQILFQTNTATSTIDTTTDQTIDVTFTWNTANASNSINSTNYLLERL
jgi:hypothetical protein